MKISTKLTVALAATALLAGGASAASAAGSKAAPRITGGAPVSIAVAPATAQLFKDGDFNCTASAIAETWVITAAHCVGEGDLSVFLGSANLGEGTEYQVVDTKVAPEGDVAVVQLDRAYEGPVATIGAERAAVDADGNVYGWGATSLLGMLFGGGASDVLKGAEVKIGGFSTDGDGGPAYRVQGVTGNGYKGDSGGPLIIGGKLVGVTSTGNALNDSATSVVNYATLDNQAEWLTETTGAVAE